MIRRQQGMTLVEALVALAVMAFGMLAMVGVQSTLRNNADVARQRSEAVRIAQQYLERWRTFSAATTKAGEVAFTDIVSAPRVQVAGNNALYDVMRTVQDVPEHRFKTLTVRVEWRDRGGTPQTITLSSGISQEEPALAAAIINPAAGYPAILPNRRHVAIPLQAKDIGNGQSFFKPPAADGGTVAWVFNNTTGMIIGTCTVSASLNAAEVTSLDGLACDMSSTSFLLSGHVWFYDGSVQPTATDAEQPIGRALNLDMSLTLIFLSDEIHVTPTCFDNAPATAEEAAGRRVVTYYCRIPDSGEHTWRGYLTVAPLEFASMPDSQWSVPTVVRPSSTHKVCRYTPATSDTQLVANWLHPRIYRPVYRIPEKLLYPYPMPPLVNQNFFVIPAAFDCPRDVPADAATGDLINSNTLFHVPFPQGPTDV